MLSNKQLNILIKEKINKVLFESPKSDSQKNEIITNVQQRLSNGENPKYRFDRIGKFYDGFAFVGLNGKWNFINMGGKLISDQWFDEVDYFINGFAQVELNGKRNFINTNGKLISDQWFNDVFRFREGFARVMLNDKCNFINKNGEIVSNQWFDSASNFENGLARVKLNGKRNFINTNGKIICNQWFDEVGDFWNGFAIVKLNGKEYYLRRDGVLCDYNTKKPLQENKINNINNINMKQSIRLTESELHNIIKESVKKILKENTNLYDVYQREIISIDPDAERFGPNFEEHPELRETKAYKDAYKYADEMDWYIHGSLHVDYRDIYDYSSDAEWETNIPRNILYQAMIDYLTNELGYDFDNDFDDDDFDDDEFDD